MIERALNNENSWRCDLRQSANCSEVRPRTAEQGPRARGCDPDPVREAPVREGALKAVIDICETGRNASAPANEPTANLKFLAV